MFVCLFFSPAFPRALLLLSDKNQRENRNWRCFFPSWSCPVNVSACVCPQLPFPSVFGSGISPSCSKPRAVLPDLQLCWPWQHTLSPQLWSLGLIKGAKAEKNVVNCCPFRSESSVGDLTLSECPSLPPRVCTMGTDVLCCSPAAQRG